MRKLRLWLARKLYATEYLLVDLERCVLHDARVKAANLTRERNALLVRVAILETKEFISKYQQTLTKANRKEPNHAEQFKN